MITSILGMIAAYLVAAGGKYLMLEKMGEEGWKGAIPFLGEYLLYKHVWNTRMFWVATATVGIGSGLAQVAHPGMALAVVGLAISFLGAAICINFYYRLSKAFGHGMGSTLCIVLVQPVMYFLLGAGRCEYVGA